MDDGLGPLWPCLGQCECWLCGAEVLYGVLQDPNTAALCGLQEGVAR